MIYMMTPIHPDIEKYKDLYGEIITPRRWARTVTLDKWCADNDAFNARFDADIFFNFLDEMLPYRDRCLFVTVPDMVGNAIATLESFRWWAWRIKAKGWPVAFVAQDGQELLPFPPEFDALFVGGTTEWKMSPLADECISRAKALDKWVHIGRVNSQTRIRHFQLIGADSCDGTAFIYAPDRELKRMSKALMQYPLFNLSLSCGSLDFTDWLIENYTKIDYEDDEAWYRARQEYIGVYGEENL